MDEHGDAQTDSLPLAERLRQLIRRGGAITFRDWMEAALYDEREGYYRRRDLKRWGREGDYRTSPERSPLFAATFARYFAARYEEMNAPREWFVLEAGAGKGDFARVVLETFARDYPKIFDAVHYVIDETSEDARARARELLAPFGKRVEFRRLAELDAASAEGVVFSNEFLDALPLHRVVRRAGGLRELCVGLDERSAFAWVERTPSTPSLAAHFDDEGVVLAEGQIAEVNLAAGEWITRAASVLRRGFVVTVDYGAEAEELYAAPHRQAGTLRAFRRHQFVGDLLAHPGEHDLTATINWTQVRQAGERAGLRTILFERQDEFLLRAGLLEELERMTERTESEAERASLRLGARELILPGGSSHSFQVLVQAR